MLTIEQSTVAAQMAMALALMLRGRAQKPHLTILLALLAAGLVFFTLVEPLPAFHWPERLGFLQSDK
ncbi:MAG: hypothetical protein ABJL67_04130 [Sulfitobacter sp.]